MSTEHEAAARRDRLGVQRPGRGCPGQTVGLARVLRSGGALGGYGGGIERKQLLLGLEHSLAP